MNALVNSQLEALKKLKRGYEQRTGRRFPISFAKYTGDVQGDARREVQTHPPQILLTNYVMAELLLVRPDDQSLLATRRAGRLALFRLRRITHLSRSSGRGCRHAHPPAQGTLRRAKCRVRRHERHDGRQPGGNTITTP